MKKTLSKSQQKRIKEKKKDDAGAVISFKGGKISDMIKIPEGELHIIISSGKEALNFTAKEKARFSVSKVPMIFPFPEANKKAALEAISETIDRFSAIIIKHATEEKKDA